MIQIALLVAFLEYECPELAAWRSGQWTQEREDPSSNPARV
jgi:hypothetical protein